MSLYLCVDCGGSKTSAVICDSSGEIKGRALGGPSNFAYLGLDNFKEAVKTAVSNALKTCISPPSIEPVPLPSSTPLFAAAWLGVSGVDSQAAIDKLTPPLSELLGIPPGPRLIVCNDAHLLAAPLQIHEDVHSAVTVIAGTGGIVVSFVEGEHGSLKEMGRVGGWGWILGDEGGGFHVGREAVRQILTRSDTASVEGPPPKTILEEEGKKTLVDRILEHFGVHDVYELLTVIHLPDPLPGGVQILDPNLPEYARIVREKRLSQLAPLVFTSAFDDGDPLALKILRTTSSMLVDQICIVLRPGAPKAVDPSDGVICFGGSLAGVDKYRQLILDQLKERGFEFKYIEFVDDAAAVGAKGLAKTAKNS
ncbi:N-acetyl-D-glucosamine kinase [Abortiporus biennis]